MNINATPTTSVNRGTAVAIAALLNHHLQLKGITATTSVKNDCLHIVLESTRVPGQQALTETIRLLDNLETQSLKKVKICSKQTNEKFPAWDEEFELTAQPSIDLTAT